MDPKSLNNLDPKMKETYDRVMGTTPAPAAAPATPAAPTAAPAPTPVPGVTPAAPTATANGPFGTSQSMPDNLQFQAAIQTPPSQPATAPVGAVPGQSSSLLKVLYVVGSIVFFVAYTFFWIKVFNVPLPF